MNSLKDIAKAADVAVMTVSRVINNPQKVKPETRRLVEKHLEAAGYTTNMAARNLVSRRTGVIDIYVPENINLNNPFIMHFMIGISEVLSERMYSLLIKRSWEKNHSCDGYIVTGLLTNEIERFYERASAKNLPVALFGHTDIEHIDCFDVDNTAGGAMAVQHLQQNNHTAIAFINVNEDKDYAVERYTGYKRALAEAGIAMRPDWVLPADNSIQGGKEAARKLLAVGGFTAIFCATDIMAIGVVNALREGGLRVPDDMSVVSFDGLGYHLLADPPLTTIGQPVFEIGRGLAQLVIERINDKHKRRTVHFMLPSLIIGKSVRHLA
jgi:LacI family transcriptional regulator